MSGMAEHYASYMRIVARQLEEVPTEQLLAVVDVLNEGTITQAAAASPAMAALLKDAAMATLLTVLEKRRRGAQA